MTAIDQNFGGIKDALKGVHDQANQTFPAMAALFDHLGKTFETNTKGFGAWGAEVMKMLGIPVAEAPKATAGLKTTAEATTALGEATVDTSASLKAAMDAANGNTTAMAALQRTNAEAQIHKSILMPHLQRPKPRWIAVVVPLTHSRNLCINSMEQCNRLLIKPLHCPTFSHKWAPISKMLYWVKNRV